MYEIIRIEADKSGKKFPITAGDRNFAREEKSISTLAKSVTYECFDCIYCGCQNVVGERLPKVNDV